MANRYWVGGSGTWNTTSTTNWSANSGGTGGASVPTTADSVFFDQASTYTVTMTGALNCLDITVSAGTVTFATGTSPTLTVAGNMSLAIGTVWNSTGTITFNSSANRTITTNGVTLNCSVTRTNTGTLSLGSALTLGTTNTLLLTQGTIALNGFDLTTGAFSSSNSNTRAINFGANNITLAHTTAGTLNLAMAITTNFTFTGTGGFRAAANITRTFQFGSTTAGGFEPNLTFTGSGTAVQTLSNSSWFKTLDFGTTAFNPGTTTLNLNSLILSTGGTYTGLSATMFRTGSIVSNGKPIAALNINVTLGTATCTLGGPLSCTTYTQTTGTFDLAGFDLTCSSTATYTAGTLLNVAAITCTTFGIQGAFTHSNGTITATTEISIQANFNYTTGTLTATPLITQSAGTTTFSKAYALTTTGEYRLNTGSLVLNNVDLTTGIFSSLTTGSTRSINFGTNYINLVTNTGAGGFEISIQEAANFTYSGTGGFKTDASRARNFSVGNISGGSTATAPNLFITSGSTTVTFTNGSWFKTIDFTGSTCAAAMSATTIGIYVDTLILATGGTYTGLIPVFTRTQTWTSQFGKQLGGIGVNGAGATLTLDNTQSYTATSVFYLTQGTLDLGGADLTIGTFSSNNSNTRAINFGSNNIILSTTTAGQINLAMANATNFTDTGTGGFRAAANITRTFQFGSTSGGTTTNAPNLTFTGSGTAVQTISTGGWFNKLDFGTTAFNPGTTALSINSLSLSTGGTYSGLTATIVGTGTIASNSNTTLLALTISAPAATITLLDTLTLTTNGATLLNSGTLDLNGFNLTTGTFGTSNVTFARAIAFGSNNIILATNIPGQANLGMGTASNFSWTGTGGFRAAADIARTFQFGSTSGGTTTNAPNLTFTGSGTAVQTISTGGWFNKLDFGTTAFDPGSTSLNLNSLTLSSGGTFTGLSLTMRGTGTITTNGKTVPSVNINHTGTTTLADAFTTIATGSIALTAGTFDLAGFTVTTGVFASNSSSTRSINFGTSNIILATTTAGVANLSMATITGLTCTGTGGFVTTMSTTRTFTVGSTAGSASSAPNLLITAGASIPTFTDGSWFKTLDFTGSTCTPAMSATSTGIHVDTLTLATGGTYTGLIPVFTRTQTWTSQFDKQLGGIGVNGADVTLTLDNTQTYTATSVAILTQGTLDLGSTDLIIGTFSSNNSNTRAISFGTNNIILSTTTAAQTNLSMATATGFTYTGTGGFRAAADITRTFTVGTAGIGFVTNSPNLTFTGSGTAVQTLTTSSFFGTLDFGTTSFNPGSATINSNTLILSTGGTFTGVTFNMRSTGTITSNGKSIGGLTITSDTSTVTLAGALTVLGIVQLFSGVLDLGGFDLSIVGPFASSGTSARSINFGSNDIVLAWNSAGQQNIQAATVTNFTWTGTGGFRALADLTRTFTFGSTAGGTATNAPNLRFIGSGTAIQTLTTGSWFGKLDFGTTAFNPGTTALNLNGLTLSSGGTFSTLTPTMVGTGTLISNGNTTLPSLTINGTGTTTLGDAFALPVNATTTLTAGTLDLGGFNLTTGIFSSNNSNVRSVSFGSNNIVLTHTTAGQIVLSMAGTTNFTCTGTGGFTTTMSVTRTFRFGDNGGASVANAPNLFITSGASVPTFIDGSWFKTLDFTGSTGTVAISGSSSGIYVDTLTLATGGTYTGLIPVFTRTQTWTSQFGKQLGGIGVNGADVTLTLDNTQTYTATSVFYLTQGTLDLGGTDLTIGTFSSSNTNTRSINFGTNNIVLATTTAGTGNLVMNTATNFTWTGTGGFRAAANITRTFTFGTSSSSGTSTSAPNLTFTGSGTAVQTITSSSWFNILDFGTTAFTVAVTALNVNSILLSSTGTYTSVTINMRGTGSITSRGKTINVFEVESLGIVTLADALTVILTTTLTQGTLDLGGFTLTTGRFLGSNTNTRSINFGAANIVLTTTTADISNLLMPIATGFTWTGTGGFTVAANITRTFTFGTTGGSSTNAPNLTFTGTGSATQTITTGSWFNRLNFGSTGFNPGNTTLNLNSLTLSNSGTFTSLDAVMQASGTITSANKTIGNLTINHSGTTTLASSLSAGSTVLTAATTTLTQGTLDLANFNFTATGNFVSDNSNTRSISFGSGNILLPTGSNDILMNNATNFTWTGTGAFRVSMQFSRTIAFGVTGGTSSNAANLSIISGSGTVSFIDGSWFKELNFTGSTGTPTLSAAELGIHVDTLTLATGGTYTNLIPVFTRTQTWTPQFSKQLGGIGVNGSGVTLTLAGTQTYTSTAVCVVQAGTINLAGNDLSIKDLKSIASSGTNRTITGGGTITLSGNWTVADGTGFAGTDYSVILTAPVTKTFAGAGGTYGTLIQKSNTPLIITGANSFADLQISNDMVQY